MAISSLSNFTVPLASDQSASNQGMLMPKLQYRFRLNFENFGTSTPTTELTKQVQDAARPHVMFDNTQIHVYNSIVNLAGKAKWQTIKISLRDDVTGAVSRLVGEQLQKQFDFLEQASAASGIDYKFTTKIEILDGGNGNFAASTLETWELYGCYLENVNYQNLSYSENAAVTIQMSIKYDNAIQTPGNTGVGTNVGRAVSTGITGGGSAGA